MKNQEIINKRHRIQGGIMLIGGLVFAAVITAYAYNGDTNIFTFIGVGITICGFLRFPQSGCLVDGNNTESMHSYNVSEVNKAEDDWAFHYSPRAIDRKYDF
jgi:hypothetical protein